MSEAAPRRRRRTRAEIDAANRELEAELRELERTDGYVAAASRALDAVIERAVSGRAAAAHPQPCTDTSCWWHHLQPGEETG